MIRGVTRPSRRFPHAVRVVLTLLALMTLVAGVAVAARRARPGRPELPVLGHIPSFAMNDQRGRAVTDATLRGEVLVVDFFYATCTTSCPRLTGRMLAVQQGLDARERQAGRHLPVRLVSITLDPDNDRPETLRAYAERAGADEARWSFLSGRSEDLDHVVTGGFNYAFERAEPAAGIGAIMHGEWIILVDAAGSLRGYYAASDSERMGALVDDAARLAAEGPGASPREGPTPSSHEGAQQAPGPKSYHAVGVVKSFGPGRAFVNISHEDIPGYMQAMTMSFEPQRAGQLDGLAERDRVEFDFVETEDARRVLTRIGERQ